MPRSFQRLNLSDVHYQAEKFAPEAKFLIESLILTIKDMEEDYQKLLKSRARYND